MRRPLGLAAGGLVALALALAPGPAGAASWTKALPLGQVVNPDGVLYVPAGVAVRLEPRRGAQLPVVRELPTVRDPETAELQVIEGVPRVPDQRGIPGGLLVPLAEVPRLLLIDGSARVRLSTRRDELASWLAVERTVARAPRPPADDGTAAAAMRELSLPWGQQATVASLRLRAAAIDDPGLRALGTAHDLAHLVPLHRTTHARSSVAERVLGDDERWEVLLQGPATVVLRLRPRTDGAWTRAEVRAELDGAPLAFDPLVGTGSAYRIEELFLTPGTHRFALEIPGVEVQARIDIAQLRQPLIGSRLPDPLAELDDPVASAELAWLRDDRDEALRAWRALRQSPGAAGELARARVLALTPDTEELLDLARLPDDLSQDGVTLATDAMLDRADELPYGLVERAVLRAQAPDAAKVARWLDGLGGTRSRGTALLRAARPLVDDGRDVPAAELRHRGLATRFTRIPPSLAEGTAERVVVGPRGPGVARVRVDAGTGVDVELPSWGPRSPVLRMRTDGPATWTLDGETWSAGAGELGVGLAAGRHRLDVQQGHVLLLDPEVATDGVRVYERRLTALPGSWTLSDPGARTDLRLVVDPPVPLRVQFDDGRLLDVEPDHRGVVDLTAGSWVERVQINPIEPQQEPVVASLEMRVRLAEPGTEPPLPITDVEAALAELTALTWRVDLGHGDARLARARLLGRMGLLTAARRDLLVLLQGEDEVLQAAARRVAGNLAPVTPSAPAPGPTTAQAALARNAVVEPAPEGPPEQRARALVAKAQALGDDPALWLAAAEAFAEAGDLPRAWQALDQAGPGGQDLRDELRGRIRWAWLAYPSGGRGISRVPRPNPGPQVQTDDPLWRRARAAMLGLPWTDADVGILRGAIGEKLTAPAGTLSLDLYCRDETGPARPCQVRLRIGSERRTVEVADGTAELVVLPEAGDHREVEVSGPGPGQALGLRVRNDGKPLPRAAELTVHRSGPGAPLRYDVGGPAMLRLHSLRGDGRVTIDGVDQAPLLPGDERWVMALVEPGAHRVEIRGDVDLRAYAGQDGERAEMVEAQLDELEGLLAPPEGALPVDVDAIFEHLGGPPLARLRAPGTRGSGELGLSAHSELLTASSTRWNAGQLFGRWMHRWPRNWAQTGGWLRGPGLAGQAYGELGRTWSRSQAGLRVDAGAARSIDNTVGQIGALAKVRADPSLGRDLDLRLEGRLRAAWLSDAPGDTVDARIWRQWAVDHPVHLVGLASLVGSPTRDLRWEAGLRATSNTGPSLDRFGPFGAVDLLLPTGTVLGLDGRMDLRLVDAHRDQASVSTSVDLSAEHGIWERDRRWWRPWASVGYRSLQGGFVASLGLRVLFSPERGLDDMPPAAVAFRPLRDLP